MRIFRTALNGVLPLLFCALLPSAVRAGDKPGDGSTAIWTGLYAGAHAGYGFTKTGGVFDSTDASPQHAGDLSKLNLDTGVAGGHLGVQWQSGHIVYGAEADLSFGLQDDSFRYNFNVTPEGYSFGAGVDRVGSIRGRLGYAMDNFLVFGTLGWGRATYTVDTSVRILGAGSSSHASSGLVYGAGLEYALDKRWSVRAEYLHYNVGKTFALTYPPHFDADTGDNIRFGDINVVRAALNFKFTGLGN